MECKSVKKRQQKYHNAKFYINNVECKLRSCAFLRLTSASSFILTMWNVNRAVAFAWFVWEKGFILTMWNVN